MIDDPVLVDDWHPIARVEQLAGGGPLAARLLGEDIVLWRSGDEFHAWRDLCVHRGTRLSLGKVVGGASLECPYHGWTYGANGRCILMPAHPEQTPPARACVEVYRTEVAHGLVGVSLGTGSAPVPTFELLEDPSHSVLMAGPYRVKASGPRVVENFLDVGHFPFVHEGILGDRARPEIAEYEATFDANGVVATGVKVFQPDPYATGEGSVVTYTYRVHRPLSASFVKHGEHSFGMLLSVTPHDAVDSTAWMWMAMNYEPEAPMIEFQDRIFAQDRPILESQRPELLPLDLQAELHLRSDRTAIAYRRWLRELGVRTGTA
ncbi:MAG TPA: aromatic ring-hydroxylating dioxygenase subunit alpha [Candidatus Dormibacteraeota bacterium]|nr:aromatic ring-hydroxylating dioxygenase subunit alpha [Candidatus Dormibacteraeota bacterium]